MIRSRFAACFALAALALVTLQGPVRAQGETLTNDGVVKLVQLGFGDDIVIAKIKQSPQVSFSLDTDGLVELREAHVSPQVIAAMLDRATPKAPPAAVLAGFPSASALGMDAIDVRLLTPTGEVPLALLRGELGSTTVMGFGAVFMNFPGLHSRVRTAERRPTLLLHSEAPPGKRLFIGSLDSDEDDDVRSLKLMSARRAFRIVQKSQQMMDPDPDWTVPFDSIEQAPGIWRLTPKIDLKPGEYGLYVDLGANIQGGGIFDFGVD